MAKLQWGHRFSSVEMIGAMRGQVLEPRSFNGATDFHRWKSGCRWASWTRSWRCFNGATDFHRWKCAGVLVDGVAQTSGFNGATDFHRWKYGTCASPSRTRTASMGPPIFIGGNILHFVAFPTSHNPLQWGHRFSSVEICVGDELYISDAMLQWGHRFSSVEISAGRWTRRASLCFNGATDFHRWKYCQARLTFYDPSVLQWGHRFSSVEICHRGRGLPCAGQASMGPPIFIGGNPTTCAVWSLGLSSFNGATDFHRWKSHSRQQRGYVQRRFNGATDFHRWK